MTRLIAEASSTAPRASLALGDADLARTLLGWIERSATEEGYLPEQVADVVQSPHMLAYWREKWGGTATPLLWSHAMHLVLLDELTQHAAQTPPR